MVLNYPHPIGFIVRCLNLEFKPLIQDVPWVLRTIVMMMMLVIKTKPKIKLVRKALHLQYTFSVYENEETESQKSEVLSSRLEVVVLC